MIPKRYLSKEDEKYIREIENTISSAGEELSKDGSKIIDDILVPLRSNEGLYDATIKRSNHHAFKSEIMLRWAIQKLMTNEDVIKKLAVDTFVHDEDESFTEEFTLKGLSLGTVEVNGREKNTSRIQIEAMPFFWKKDGTIAKSKKTGLPFRIRAIRLVPEKA